MEFARYYSPPGFWAWGNRYLSVPTILLSALAFPAWLQLRVRLSTMKRAAFAAVVVWSIAIQLSSIVLYAGNEMIQSRVNELIQSGAAGRDATGVRVEHIPIVFLRFDNIVTMIREGIRDPELMPRFVAVRALYLKSGDAHVLPFYLRWGILIAWSLSFVSLLAPVVSG
jgi:hypothetical protein